MVVQCQTINPKNTHASNIMWTEQVIFRNYTYIYIHERRVYIIEESRRGQRGMLEGGRKERNIVIIL